MQITASMVKELREVTGAGMMDCKKALAEVDGDMEKAVDYLREKGLAGAQKKAGRIAAEGIVMNLVSEDQKHAVTVEVNAETDFVAKNEKFRSYVEEVAAQILNSDVENVETFLAAPWALDPSLTVEQKLSEMISVIGENMRIRRFEKVNAENGFVASYIHGGGKIGVLVKVESDVFNEELKEMARNVAMQIAALRPQFCSDADVPADFIEKETAILKAQIDNDPKEMNKPEKVKEGMIRGRLQKELKEVCLMDQIYVRAEDGKQIVKDYVAQTAKANGANLKIVSFTRFETGEGLEKRNEDFAAEVAKQINH